LFIGGFNRASGHVLLDSAVALASAKLCGGDKKTKQRTMESITYIWHNLATQMHISISKQR
jgi:hypothetical protein